MRELAFSLRSLVRAPLLLGTAVLTLAIGLGLATGVYAVAHGLLLRPLPYGDPSRLVVISLHRPAEPDTDVGLGLVEAGEWRQRVRTFDSIGAYSRAEFTMRGAGDPRSVRVAMVTDGFFETLALPAVEGTTDPVAGVNPALALSASLAEEAGPAGAWRERGVTLGHGHFGVVAVMPRTFTFPSERIGAWVAAAAVPAVRLVGDEDQREFRLIARLAPGVSLQQAQDDAARVAGELNAGKTEGRRKSATVKRLDDVLRRDARTNVLPFAAGAALVLLITCANVSGLLMSRAAVRQREFAVRRALGGSSSDILRASIAESVGITTAGWVLGMVIAHLVIRGFVAFGSVALPGVALARVDLPVLAASFAAAVMVALLCGAAPALRAIRVDSGAVLKGSREGQARAVGGFRGALVVGQIALTIVLLVGAGLLARTVLSIVRSERGFDAAHGLAARLMLSETVRYNVTDRADHVSRLVAEIRALPGVVSAGIGSDLPPRDTQLLMTVRIVSDGRSEILPLTFSAVTPGYLESIGVTLRSGRLFEDRDGLAEVPSVVISASAARRMFADRDPVGREWPATIPVGGVKVRPRVIGVIGDVAYGGLEKGAGAAIYVPWATFAPSQAYLVLRTTGDPLRLSGAVRQTVQRLDPTLPVYTPESLEEVVAGSMAARRLRLQLAVTFAGLALLLAAVALWGAVAQGVLERRREIAIRMAIGSTGREAVRLVLRRGVGLIATGVAAGLLAAGVSARGMRHLLHGVEPLDPVTFAVGATLVTALSLLACYAPARQAAAISPAELLRDG